MGGAAEFRVGSGRDARSRWADHRHPLGRGPADVSDRSCHPKVAGQASACKCGAGAFDATPPENLTQVCRSWGPRNPTLRPGLRPEGVALRAVRLTGCDEPGTFGTWLMTSPSGTAIC